MLVDLVTNPKDYKSQEIIARRAIEKPTRRRSYYLQLKIKFISKFNSDYRILIRSPLHVLS